MTTDRSSSPVSAEPGAPSDPQRPAEVDIRLLAEKVYRLMLADLRLSQARGGRAGRRRGRP